MKDLARMSVTQTLETCSIRTVGEFISDTDADQPTELVQYRVMSLALP